MSHVFVRSLAMAAVVAALARSGPAAEPAEPSAGELQRQLQALTERLAQLEQKESGNWLDAARADQVRVIVQDVLAEAKKQGAAAEGAICGYDKGFYIQTADKNFRLSVNGFVQARYTFASDRVHDASRFATTPRGGDVNGFDFRRARLTFQGNALTPDLTYCFTYDFAGDAGDKNPVASVTTDGTGHVTGTTQTSVPTDKNYSQIVDLYAAYRFNDWLNVRVGSFLSPFSRVECLVAGAEFTDLPTIVAPFDPVRSMGLSIFGQPVKDQFSYELNVNNGQCSNVLGRAGEVSTSGTTSSNAGNNDNRLATYLRLQYAGAGKLSDFGDEPDLRKDNRNLAWMAGGAFGYESANTTNSAFPSPQASVSIPVGAGTTEGFASYPLNGDLYRATLDAAAKYQGLSFNAACYFQQINENAAVAGGTAPTLPAGYTIAGGKTSFCEFGYYGQLGYMLTKDVELVGRAGQFFTEGNSNHMEELAVGLNYYIYGHNFKIQTDLTFIPDAAASTSSVLGTAANTEDLIFRVQLQLKF